MTKFADLLSGQLGRPSEPFTNVLDSNRKREKGW